MPVWGSLYFQNSSSFIIEQLIFFHDYTMVMMIIVIFLVGYILVISCYRENYNLMLFEGQELEIIWTILPGLFLVFIAFPSLRLLYLMEETDVYDITIKLLGRQWYWSYEYRDFEFKMFDSYMKRDNDTIFRILDVDNCLLVPFITNIRLIVSGVDVIHSWTIPSLGIKVDAIPGRLNQLFLNFRRIGGYFGECSEICGANHRFIPIKMLVVPRNEFLSIWI